VDFCAPRRKLIVEVDGGQHLEQEEYDVERTRFLESLGYTVLRFWNNDIMKDIEGVVRVILDTLNSGDVSSIADHTD
jgi:very-short-patch-repair endonuclease